MAAVTLTAQQIAQHNTPNDCYVLIRGVVYDVTSFADAHPGGRNVLLRWGGKDATEEFEGLHSDTVLMKYGDKLRVGVLQGYAEEEQKKAKKASKTQYFGNSRIPYAEPMWYSSKFKSPYYNESHRNWRAKVRAFVDAEMLPHVAKWDKDGEAPDSFTEALVKNGLFAPNYPAEWGGTPPEGGFDAFKMLIMEDEFARAAAGGVTASTRVYGIGLPPVYRFGSEELKKKVVREVVTGKKVHCLCITEPYGGSDVASLRTTAVKKGNVYIVNGEKKYITGGCKAAYYTVAARTGGAGMFGVSLLLLENGMKGITVRRQPTQGWLASNTGYVTFEDVEVPVGNLIGQENQGFIYIMYNFNGERMAMAIACARYARVCLEEAVKYARKRVAFGGPLSQKQVIRHKIADMARRIESLQCLLENICFNIDNGANDIDIGGIIALAKVEATQCYEYCAREASQVMGGVSYIRGGIGERVERLYREVRVNAIGGGSEEIMKDLAMRQAKL